jgi:tetratricopeptide (TPR) repeat protein
MMEKGVKKMQKTLLIGLDGAEWNFINPLLKAGLMPNLQRLTQPGQVGMLNSFLPHCAPALWTSLLTGKRADRHNILSAQVLNSSTGGVSPVNRHSRSVKAIWNILTENGIGSTLVGLPVTHPAESILGVCLSDAYPGGYDLGKWQSLAPEVLYPLDADLFQTLDSLRMHPNQVTGEMISPLIPALSQIDRDGDRRPAALGVALARSLSLHNATTWLLENRPTDFTAVCYPLLDEVSRTFLPYHPPKPQSVTSEDFEKYQYVLAGTYRFVDLLLGRLLDLVGRETTVIIVSGHGFFLDESRRASGLIGRERPIPQLRPTGILVMAGRGIQSQDLIYAPSILDIVPTLLAACGLPVSQDLEGRPWIEAFAPLLTFNSCPSWENTGHDTPILEPQLETNEKSLSDLEVDRLMSQLANLGETDPLAQVYQVQQEKVNEEREYNRYLMQFHRGEMEAAIATLTQACDRFPQSLRLRLELLQTLTLLAHFNTVRPLAANLLDTLTGMNEQQIAAYWGENNPLSHSTAVSLLQGILAFTYGELEKARSYLEEAANNNPRVPWVKLFQGLAYLRMQDFFKAEQAFRDTITLDPQQPQAYAGLLDSLVNQKRWQEAVAPGLRAVELCPTLTKAHFQLGVALAQLGAIPRAVEAFQTAQKQAPQWPAPRQWLARLSP